MSENIKKVISQKIIDKLENFEGIWKKPWFTSQPSNPVTGTTYTGTNVFTLGMLGKTGQFATYKQIASEGGQVKKGAESLPVVFYTQLTSKTEVNKAGTPKSFAMLRYYNVFDLADCEGVEHLVQTRVNHVHPIESCENLVGKTGAKIIEASHAFYSPKLDHIGMVPASRFESSGEYYSTLFHELTHWTGHESRLDRFEAKNSVFSSQEYSFEELVAELGSCMLTQHFGMLDQVSDNSKAYLKSWLGKLKTNPEHLFNALSKSHKAYQLITERK
jgi:antirestriction protein ArdC